MGIEAKPTMVKPNIDEIRMLTGSHCDTREELIEAGKKMLGALGDEPKASTTPYIKKPDVWAKILL